MRGYRRGRRAGRIICVGNRYVAQDSAGHAVYRLLRQRPLPDEVELIDGGIAGLGLLPLIEGAQRVVFVDAVSGWGGREGVVVLEAEEVAALADGGGAGAYGHGAGLPALLRLLPAVAEGPLPGVIRVVGVEHDGGARAHEAAARRALAEARPSGAGGAP